MPLSERLIRGIWTVLGFFLIFVITGFIYGTTRRVSEAYLPKVLIRHTDVTIVQDSVAITFQCGRGMPSYKYNVNDEKIDVSVRETKSRLINPSIVDAFPVSKELALSLIGGAGGGYTLKNILMYYEESKAGQTIIDVIKKDVRRNLAILISIVTGYRLGDWASGIFEPECGSEALREKITSHEFWKQAGISSLLMRSGLIDKCITDASSVIEHIDKKIEVYDAKDSAKFSGIFTEVREGYSLFKESNRINAEGSFISIESAPTPEDFKKQIQIEENCYLYLGFFHWAEEVLKSKDPAESQYNLGRALELLGELESSTKRLEEAAASFSSVLQVNPNDERAYNALNFLYHDKLFAFAEAFDLNQGWLERHPDKLDAQANFAEAAFTVGRFAEAEQRLAALVDDPKLEPGNMVALRALEICSLVALDRPDTLRTKLNALSDLLKGDRGELANTANTWIFAGSLHFISERPDLSRHLWLIQLLAAVNARDAADARDAVEIGQAASAAAQ